MNNFWQNRENPFFILAPMEDVTDTVFREVVMSVSNPEVLNVLFTEFTSTDGLLDERGYHKVSERLIINASERELLQKRNTKLVAQIWGKSPEKYFKTAQFLSESGNFDGIDINMGCPVKKVVKKGCCSALITNSTLAIEIIQATKEGSNVPVSVKTRTGLKTVDTEAWATLLLEQDIAALTIHGRTQKMQSEGLADWNEIGKVVQLRNALKKNTAIIGNGDIDSYQEGMERISEHGLEGVMIGRGIFKNPWLFNKLEVFPTEGERIQLLLNHLNLFTQTWDTNKNFNVLKRFFKIYLNSFPSAGAIRAVLMSTKAPNDVKAVLSGIKELSY